MRNVSERLIAADAEEIAGIIAEGVLREYNDAADEPVPYESAEGGYQFRTMSTWDLLTDELELDLEDGFLEYVVDDFPDYAWIQRNPLSLARDQALTSGWENFCQQVKHETRYLFFELAPDDRWSEDVRPEQMLDAIGEIVKEVGLLTTLPKGTVLFRARVHACGEIYSTIADLGPPPVCDARYANRMSPAGISMFYGSEDSDTALAETYYLSAEPKEATIATIVLNEDVTVVDLANLPGVPSLFSRNDDHHLRPGLIFLHDFVADLSKPIARDGLEHIEYVPTQVVSEFFRYRFRVDGERISGLRYPSGRGTGGVNIAIFVSHEMLIGTDYEKPVTILRIPDHGITRSSLPPTVR